jgi:hypothetical protein
MKNFGCLKRRLERAKTQTETTKLLENAIEKVEYANEDEMRLRKLEDQTDSLSYTTKPRLDKTQIISGDKYVSRSRSRDVQPNSNRSLRARSLSGSKSSRYKHVKPKLVTRLDSAGSLNASRTPKNEIEDNFDDESKPIFNDTEAMRFGFFTTSMGKFQDDTCRGSDDFMAFEDAYATFQRVAEFFNHKNQGSFSHS